MVFFICEMQTLPFLFTESTSNEIQFTLRSIQNIPLW
jgi:hypothetical protein